MLFYLLFYLEPTISIQIKLSVIEKIYYTLICVVNGTESLDHTLIYQWTKNNDTQMQNQVSISNPSVLSLSPLRLSDAGQYTCQVTVSSPYLRRDITLTDSWNVIFSQS